MDFIFCCFYLSSYLFSDDRNIAPKHCHSAGCTDCTVQIVLKFDIDFPCFYDKEFVMFGKAGPKRRPKKAFITLKCLLARKVSMSDDPRVR